jgi:hypothetical protein
MSGTSVLPYRYRINGVLSTDKTVMQNMEMITSAAQSWLTYDINLGKWAVVINEPGTSTVSFDDSNIIGPISVQGTGLRELYNTVRVEFPHVDLADEPDYIEDTIPEVDRNANEPDNTLVINLDLINDPVMAESLGIVELKQSRVDRVIRFTTDYTHLGIKAGDLIDVTNSVLGYTNKMFRVVSMAEADAEDGGLNITITALEYDANVYDLSDIFRYERSNQNGLVTIGYVGAPTTPTITAFANSARPRTSIATTVPTGIVDGIEFWFSSDGTNYVLLSTETPTTGAFTYGETVTYDYDKYVVTSNVYAKCRAINSTTSSDYSSVGSLLNFAPVQITDAIQDGTTALRNSSGGSLATALGIATLVNKVGTAFGNNSGLKLSDAVFTQAGFPAANSIPIFNTFQTTLSPAAVDTAFDTYIGTTPIAFGTGYAATGNGAVLSFSLSSTVQQLMIVTQCPQVNCSYQYYDNGTSSVQTRSGTFAYMPCLYEIYRTGTLIQTSTADWQTQSIILLIENATAASYQIRVKPLVTYDLNQTTYKEIYFYDQTTIAQASGGGITSTAFGFTVLP